MDNANPLGQCRLLRISIFLFWASMLAACNDPAQVKDNCTTLAQSLKACAAGTADSGCSVRRDQFAASLGNLPIIASDLAMWVSTCAQACRSDTQRQANLLSQIPRTCRDMYQFNTRDHAFRSLTAGIAVLAFGFVAFSGSVYSWRTLRAVRATRITTTGKVVEQQRWEQRGRVLYAPVIAFTDRHGTEHRFTAGEACTKQGNPCLAVGSSVKIQYPELAPESAREASALRDWLAPSASGLFACLLFSSGLLLLFSAQQWRTHEAYLQRHAPALAKSLSPTVHRAHSIWSQLSLDNLRPQITINGLRVVEAGPDFVKLAVDYHLPAHKHDSYWMGAITLRAGDSSGEWSYRPARLSTGMHTANVWLGMNNEASAYCSDEIKISIYQPGQVDAATRTFTYEKCWQP